VLTPTQIKEISDELHQIAKSIALKE
jgi:hypothetical protein